MYSQRGLIPTDIVQVYYDHVNIFDSFNFILILLFILLSFFCSFNLFAFLYFVVWSNNRCLLHQHRGVSLSMLKTPQEQNLIQRHTDNRNTTSRGSCPCSHRVLLTFHSPRCQRQWLNHECYRSKSWLQLCELWSINPLLVLVHLHVWSQTHSLCLIGYRFMEGGHKWGTNLVPDFKLRNWNLKFLWHLKVIF